MAITIALAAVVYVTVMGLAPSGGSTHGPIFFLKDTASSTSTVYVWRISGTDLDPRTLAAYKVILVINGSTDDASTFEILVNGKHGKVEFTSTDNRLNVGDVFAVDVYPNSYTDYDLVVFLRETGSELGRAEWQS